MYKRQRCVHAGIDILTSTARSKILHFPCYTHTEIFMDAYVKDCNKESHCKEILQHLPIEYNHDWYTCSNSISKLGRYIGDPHDRNKYFNTVY